MIDKILWTQANTRRSTILGWTSATSNTSWDGVFSTVLLLLIRSGKKQIPHSRFEKKKSWRQTFEVVTSQRWQRKRHWTFGIGNQHPCANCSAFDKVHGANSESAQQTGGTETGSGRRIKARVLCSASWQHKVAWNDENCHPLSPLSCFPVQNLLHTPRWWFRNPKSSINRLY